MKTTTRTFLTLAAGLFVTSIMVAALHALPSFIPADGKTPAFPIVQSVGAGGETITVTTLNDISDFSGAQQVSDLPGPDGRVSFREAVTAANNTPGGQTIAFAIPLSEFWLMQEVALLRLEEDAFFLNDSGTTVDFSTQTTNIGDTNPNGPEVGIFGLQPNGGGAAAIFVNGDNCVIKGLGWVSQRASGVRLVGNNNRVVDCRIEGTYNAAVQIQGYFGFPPPSGNIVGGTAPGDGNYLAGLFIGGPAENNVVIGNTIIGGVDVTGATRYGVIARNNRIGGPSSAERNVISGAGGYGEEGFPLGDQVSVVDADGTLVEGNYIGTTVDGMAAYPQQIGPIGVEVYDARGTTVRGNLIAGLRAVGTNHYNGIIFGQAIHVGATNSNTQDTTIEGNTIGLAADGTTAIPTRSGISVTPLSGSYHAFNTRIASNHIASVETTGVVVGNPENGVMITGNSIHDSGGLGIDLFAGNFSGVGGVTPNDPGDGDTGGNGLQNFPVLQSSTTTGSTVMIQGTLDTSPSGQFTIEFFASPSCDPSGFGEGAVFLGSTTVTTNGAGHATFSVTLPANVAVGAKATATATRLSTGDTSEFSACVAVSSGGLPSPSPTPVATPTATATATATPTVNATATATATVTPIPSPIATSTPTATATATAAATPVPSPIATSTPTATATATATASVAPSATPSSSPTPQPTATATATPRKKPKPKAINLSSRMRVETGDRAGIGGFIVTGTVPKQVVIRGIGPSLSVPNALADPMLEVHGAGGFAAISNDNWRDTDAAAIQATGIPPTNDRESAILATLPPGAYTAVMTGKGNTSGVAVVEVYDLSQTESAKLANMSTRAFVSTGDNILIAGFVLADTGVDDRVVVRGVGPSLTGAGVTNALADPILELRNVNGALIATNNNWRDNPAAADEISAAGLAPTNEREAAIATTLPPGVYTALLSGGNDSTGIGVVEVYDRGEMP